MTIRPLPKGQRFRNAFLPLQRGFGFLIQKRVFAHVFTALCSIADARYFSDSAFAPHCAKLRRLTHKTFHTEENDRERFGLPIVSALLGSPPARF
ncbi:MAG: hypothetical protein DMF07_01315 [Verrucomicrobia bacterium]|nr:MAG: hypothetical protein DMF07_01315 [Verrucomicrobiota bacterium]